MFTAPYREDLPHRVKSVYANNVKPTDNDVMLTVIAR